MTQKVTLPADVAHAIDEVRKKLDWPNEVILRKVYQNGWEAEYTQVLNVGDDEEKALLIAKALINGYKIELSPEDHLRCYYVRLKELEQEAHRNADHDSESEFLSEQTGVIMTLNQLGIKVAGINA